MTEKRELLLKEIEELRANYLPKLAKRRENNEWEGHEEEEDKFDEEVKNRMLGDLSNWALDPQGFFYPVNGRLKVIETGTNFHSLPNEEITFREHFRSSKRNEIVNAFINEIKQNPQDWKIKKAKPEEIIINGHLFTYGTHRAVEHKSERKHYKPDFEQLVSFLPEEWAEIENALKNQKTDNDNKELVGKKNELQIEEDKNKKTNQNIYYRVGLVSLVLLLISMVVVRMKKKW